MDDKKTISLAVIKRLPRYYRYLTDLLASDITRVSSKNLSDKMNLTASQIRQDLNNFGCFGQQGYGYNVESLHFEIQKILGLGNSYNLIILGAGNIGQALMNYPKFKGHGFNFTALFDVNPKLIGLSINGIEVLDIDYLEDFLKNNHVDIAVLTLPSNSAESIANIVINNGVKGIWNFSHIDLSETKDVVVENVHLTDSLMTLSYNLSHNKND